MHTTKSVVGGFGIYKGKQRLKTEIHDHPFTLTSPHAFIINIKKERLLYALLSTDMFATKKVFQSTSWVTQ